MISLRSLIARGRPSLGHFALHRRPAIARPERDWHIVLTGHVVALAALVVTGFVVYWQGRIDRRVDPSAMESKSLSPAALEELLQKYQALEAEYEALLAATTTAIADPSLSR